MACELEPIKISEWVAIGIAVLALGTSVWQAREARKQAAIAREHNRMSVLPMLVHEEHWETMDNGALLTLSIKNCGPGVALIKDRYFSFNRNRYNATDDGHAAVNEFCDFIFKGKLSYQCLHSGMLGKSSKLPPGATFLIAKIFFGEIKSDPQDTVRNLAKNADFVIDYESLYGESFHYNFRG